jgi:flagellar biosynthetic protein FliP
MNIIRLSLLLSFFFLLPEIAYAESITVDFQNENQTPLSSRMLQILALITVLSIAPSILIMITSFTRIVIVFSLLRTALGLQQTPPNSVLLSLALFLTFFIMSPTFEKAYDDGIKPLINNAISEEQAFELTISPFKDFMYENVREKDLSLFTNIAKLEINTETNRAEILQNLPLHVLIPSFMLSELKRGFEIGFLIFLPFLIIDMVVASILMAMGMMMIPPVMISLPFKLIFFVLIDGWYTLSGSLVKSYGLG